MIREIEKKGSKKLRNNGNKKKNKFRENEDSSRRQDEGPDLSKSNSPSKWKKSEWKEKARKPWNNIDEKGGERVCNHEMCKCINHSTPEDVFILDFLL